VGVVVNVVYLGVTGQNHFDESDDRFHVLLLLFFLKIGKQ
jgi:hypothetical protein